MFVRIISSRKKWTRIPTKETRLPSDCFYDIRTTDNMLSLWKYDDFEDDGIINQCIVVGALGRQKIEKVSYVLIEDSELTAVNLTFTPNDPKCAFLNPEKEDFIGRHYDIQEIDDQDYVKIANIIISKIENGEVKILSKDKVTKAFKKMKEEGLLLNKGLSVGISNEIF